MEEVIWGPDETHRHSPEDLRKMDEVGHYMESTSRLREQLERERSARHAAEKVNAAEVLAKRTNLNAQIESLRAENEELREVGDREREYAAVERDRREAAEATMREVAEELRQSYERHNLYHAAYRLADRLDPPPVVENPPA